ncbi:MAG: hypothetical protein V1739_02685 [Candidatus Omnitrophota bacterium]
MFLKHKIISSLLQLQAQEYLKGKIIRIGSMGHMNEFDIITGISCIELVLLKMGYKFEHGTGVGSAQKELLKSE